MKRLFIFSSLLLVGLNLLVAQSPSPFLHVDQFGYYPDAEKVAVLSDPQIGQNAALSFTPSATLQIRDAADDAVVWSGAPTLWNGGATQATSGDRGWWLDFSDLTALGNYYVFDPGSGERSATFEIGDGVYDEVLKDAGRAFFYNRCNAPKSAPYAEVNWTDGMNFANPLQDTECSYVNDRENANLRRDLSGGWFDAGDYNKYVTFAQGAVQPLLWAYMESPGVFTDAWNIPESGNGIPDLLDEVKWEIDWLRKMVNPDGSVILKMGSIDFSDNAAAPPSANTDRRYYGPTCTSASIAASAMLAQAANVFAGVGAWSAYADEIEVEAEAAFAYWLAADNADALETDCDDGTINAGDADGGGSVEQRKQAQREDALNAAVHLFERTGKAQYNDYVRDNLTDAEYINGGWWGPYKNEMTSALVHYTQLPGAHTSAVNAIRTSMTPHVRDDWNGFYGFNSDGLYRAFMPESSFHWGSNMLISYYGNLNRVMGRGNIVPGSETNFNRKADNMIHYLHGVNALGLVYLSGMEGRGAERGIQEIYHTWFNNGTDWDNSETSLYGPAPGFVAGGPNKDFTIGSISPPAGEPAMKAYKDWNTGFPENSWEITEPAIYYQAAYIRNLAAMMSQGATLPVTYRSPFTARAQTKSVLLQWEVATEENASHYEVEYLDNRDIWRSLGRVTATGAPGYSFVHTEPRTGENDYRLKQLDTDGTFAYSNIATVNFYDRYANIKLFPNPIPEGTDQQLTGLPPGAELRLVDASGRLLYRTFLRGSQLELPTRNLPTGWYQVELSQGREGVVWSQKMVVQ